MQSTMPRLQRQLPPMHRQPEESLGGWPSELQRQLTGKRLHWWAERSISLAHPWRAGRLTPTYAAVDFEGTLELHSVRKVETIQHRQQLRALAHAYPFLRIVRVIENRKGLRADTIECKDAPPMIDPTPSEMRGILRKAQQTPNRTELRYQSLLARQMHGPWLRWWGFEKITFLLGDDCRYTPDYFVVGRTPEGLLQLEAHEVKAYWRAKGKKARVGAREDSIVKLRVAAHLYPFVRFVLAAEWTKGQFTLETVSPGPPMQRLGSVGSELRL